MVFQPVSRKEMPGPRQLVLWVQEQEEMPPSRQTGLRASQEQPSHAQANQAGGSFPSGERGEGRKVPAALGSSCPLSTHFIHALSSHGSKQHFETSIRIESLKKVPLSFKGATLLASKPGKSWLTFSRNVSIMPTPSPEVPVLVTYIILNNGKSAILSC